MWLWSPLLAFTIGVLVGNKNVIVQKSDKDLISEFHQGQHTDRSALTGRI
jgi:hypothetical protein